MKINKFISLITILFLFFSCSKEEVKVSIINEKSLDAQMFEAYKEGKDSLEGGDVLFAKVS